MSKDDGILGPFRVDWGTPPPLDENDTYLTVSKHTGGLIFVEAPEDLMLTDARETIQKCDAELGRRQAVIDELRAVLAMVLDDPIEYEDGSPFCVFCTRMEGEEGSVTVVLPSGCRFTHKINCPTHRADVFLGRTVAPGGVD
jgi:hypothetical protein